MGKVSQCFGFLIALFLMVGGLLAQGYPTDRASLNGFSIEGDNDSLEAVASDDGRYVAFASRATTFSNEDPDARIDVFLRDRHARTLDLLSIGTGGVKSNGDSRFPVITPDGVYVAFESTSSTFFAVDDNAQRDVFVRDWRAQRTELISQSVSGGVGNGSSGFPALSADGRWVAFVSDAPDLVEDDMNNEFDVFLRDRVFGTTRRVSVAPGGGETGGATSAAPAMSADGSYIAYTSRATDILDGETMGFAHVYLWDRTSGAVELVSRSPEGHFGVGDSFSPSISGDGRFVAFSSQATNLVDDDANGHEDIFVLDRQTQEMRLVSVSSEGYPAMGDSFSPSIDADGERVVFASLAGNLALGEPDDGVTDLYAHELRRQLTIRQSLTWLDRETDQPIRAWRVTGSGNWATFDSTDGSLAPDDSNSLRDSYVRWVGEPLIEREPNDDFIDRTWINLDAHEFGAVSGKLSSRGYADVNPDTYLVAYDKEDLIIAQDDNSSTVGDGKASALWLEPVAHGDGSASIRLGVTGRPDGVDGALNGLFFNGYHQQLGEVEVVVRYFDEEGFPVVDQNEEILLDVQRVRFVTGGELFRLNYDAPPGTHMAHVELDNSVGRRDVCDDVDFFTLSGFPPACDIAVTLILCPESPFSPVRLGWFDKNAGLVTSATSEAESPSGLVTLGVISDASGRVIVAVTGQADFDFDGASEESDARDVAPEAPDGGGHGTCATYSMIVDILGHLPPEDLCEEMPMEHLLTGDINADGGVDVLDLSIMLSNWGVSLP